MFVSKIDKMIFCNKFETKRPSMGKAAASEIRKKETVWVAEQIFIFQFIMRGKLLLMQVCAYTVPDRAEVNYPGWLLISFE